MKKIVLLSLILGLIWSCENAHEKNTAFTIKGTIKNYKDSLIFLKVREDGKWVSLDSAKVEDGKFSLKGHTEQAQIAYLLNQSKNIAVQIYLESADMTVDADAEHMFDAKITGSNIHDSLDVYNKQVQVYNDKLQDCYKQYQNARQNKDEKLLKKIDSLFISFDEERTNFIKKYIARHTSSPAVPYILYKELSYDLEPDEMEVMLSKIDKSLWSSKYYKIIEDKIKILNKVAVGKKAPDFTLNDTSGNPVSLYQFTEKYVLIDFWASWCRPCRAENPGNVKLYAKYKDKGLAIFGVSLDKDKEAWTKAIKKDGLTWTQVSDLQGWNCAPAKLYGVSGIPHTVLLDENKIIIAKNLVGEELSKKISELLD